jgi:hypothetical protein
MHPELRMLKVEAANLVEAWKVFQLEVPEESRADFKECDQTPNGLVKMVETVATAWHTKRTKSKFGKFMKVFHRVCGTVDTHRTVLTMLPQGNEYVSLFSGALMSIITVNSPISMVPTIKLLICMYFAGKRQPRAGCQRFGRRSNGDREQHISLPDRFATIFD